MSFKKSYGSPLKIFSLIILWALITSAGPFLFNKIAGHPQKFLIAFVLAVMIVILLAKNKIIIGDKNIIVILAIQLVYFLLLFIYYTDYWYLTKIPLLISLGIIYIFVQSIIGVDETIKSVLVVMVVIGILGVIGFFLAITGLLDPTVLYYRSIDEPVYSYIVTFTNLIFDIGSGQLIRVGGFFAEGGELGFYIIHALILNKLVYNNRKIEIALILSGVLTFSFAFYLSSLIYLVFFYANRKSIIYLLGVFLIIFVLLQLVNYYKSNNSLADYVYDLTFRRFEFSEDSILKGNNRMVGLPDAINSFLKKPLFGYGNEYLVRELPVVDATIMGPLVTYGLVGSAIYFLQVIYLCVIAISIRTTTNNNALIKSALILLFNYLQRPFVLSLFCSLIIILIAEAFRRQSPQWRNADKRAVVESTSFYH